MKFNISRRQAFTCRHLRISGTGTPSPDLGCDNIRVHFTFLLLCQFVSVGVDVGNLSRGIEPIFHPSRLFWEWKGSRTPILPLMGLSLSAHTSSSPPVGPSDETGLAYSSDLYARAAVRSYLGGARIRPFHHEYEELGHGGSS